jgi:hypothetical protein
MNTQSNRDKIKQHVIDMLNQSHEAMLKKVDKALDSGAIDTESWDENYNPIVLPKCIVTAILQDESTQYEAKGTSFHNKIRKEVRNIRYYL